jgi:hypothetical protein
MAYFTKIDENNIVKQVEVVSDTIATTEQNGIDFLKQLYGDQFNWKQTFDDGTRKNYAGIGYTYDSVRDAFIPPQPYNSWTLNEDTCQWQAPVAKPDDGKAYEWVEATTNWKEII